MLNPTTLTVSLWAAALTTLTAPALAQPTAEQIGDAVDRLVDEGESGQVAVVLGGELLYRADFGEASQDAEGEAVPVSGDTLFYIGSIAKVFTSATVLELVEAGELSLDDTVGAFFEEVPEDKQGITIEWLLCHRSGLIANHEDPLTVFDRAGFESWALSTPLNHEPGEAWEYSNVGFALLAAIIERVTEKDYQTAVRELVIEPSGMTETFFLTDEFDRGLLATGHGPRLEGFGFSGDLDSMEWTWLRAGAGAMVSTAGDLLRFHQALDAETVLSGEQLDLATQPTGSAQYGLGWQLSGSGNGVHFHQGGFPGFSAEFIRLPRYDGAIIAISNQDEGGHRIRDAIERAGQ